MNEARPDAVRSVTLAELEPIIREAFAAGMTFKLPVTGTSNLPTLVPGRDEIVLDEVTGPLKKGALPLYRRDNGKYVLHRIVSVQKDGSYVCCGDHQWQIEPGVRQDQIIGVTVSLIRKGHTISTRHVGYRLWVRLWTLLRPCRRSLIRISHIPRRIKRLLTRR